MDRGSWRVCRAARSAVQSAARGTAFGALIYHRPTTIEEALSLLNQGPEDAAPFAGGTDLMPRWSTDLSARPSAILDLKHIAELRGVTRDDGEIRVGACTLMTEIESDRLIRSSAPVLAEAAGRIACHQIRNRATIGGNLCNASPAADTAIPLILLDAVIEIASGTAGNAAMRGVPITDFFRGPGSTVLETGEIVTHIRFKPMPEGSFASWNKFGTRPSMEIAVASVGLLIRVESGTVTHARVGYGSVAPTPLRGCKAEAALLGNRLTEEVIGKCEAAAREEVSPISDVRAGGSYRRDVVAVMLRRMLEDAASS